MALQLQMAASSHRPLYTFTPSGCACAGCWVLGVFFFAFFPFFLLRRSMFYAARPRGSTPTHPVPPCQGRASSSSGSATSSAPPRVIKIMWGPGARRPEAPDTHMLDASVSKMRLAYSS
jgi:hypothetical protein